MKLTEIEDLIEKERLYLLETDGLVTMPKLVARAAYAIFERLREDVVWDGETPAYLMGDGTVSIFLVPRTIGKDTGVRPNEMLQVTVRRKNES